MVSIWRKTKRKAATWLMLMSSASRASLGIISLIGCFFTSEKVELGTRWAHQRWVCPCLLSLQRTPGLHVRIGSVHRAQGIPSLPVPAQCIVFLLLRVPRGHAKYEGQKRVKAHTMTMGITMSLKSCWHSSLCSWMTLTVCHEKPIHVLDSPSLLCLLSLLLGFLLSYITHGC